MHYVIIAIGILTVFLLVNGGRGRQKRQLRKIAGFRGAVVHTPGRHGRGLAMSQDAMQFALTNTWRGPTLYQARDIIAVEVLRNGDSINTVDRGSQIAGAAIGALLLGPVGLLVGGLSGRRRQAQKVSSLVLRIVTTDMKRPVLDIVFLRAKPPGVDAGSKRLQRAAVAVAEWQGRFQTAMRGPVNAVDEGGPTRAETAPHSP